MRARPFPTIEGNAAVTQHLDLYAARKPQPVHPVVLMPRKRRYAKHGRRCKASARRRFTARVGRCLGVDGTNRGTVEPRRGKLLVGDMVVALPEDEPPEIVVRALGGGLFQADLVARSSGYGKGRPRLDHRRAAEVGADPTTRGIW